MLRTLLPLVLLAGPALADPGVDYRHEEAADGTIRIVVPAADLLACRITLAMVLNPVAMDEHGNPLPEASLEAVAEAQDLPAAVCVTDES